MKPHTAKTAVTTAALTLLVAVPAYGEVRFQNGVDLAPSALALGSVPPHYLAWYQHAAHTCRGLAWPVLAGIGEVESGHGKSTAPGVHSSSNYEGAQGPMQFEPATFATYAVHADTRHPLSVYNAKDAIFSAAKMLCSNGAASGTPIGLQSALLSYNASGWYPAAVLGWATKYSTGAAAGSTRPMPPSSGWSPSVAAPVPLAGNAHVPALAHRPLPLQPIGGASMPLQNDTPADAAAGANPAGAASPVNPASPVTAEPPAGAPAAGAVSPGASEPALTGPQITAPSSLLAEADRLSADARQYSAESARLSALAARLYAEARQVPAKPAAQGEAQLPSQPQLPGQPQDPGQLPAVDRPDDTLPANTATPAWKVARLVALQQAVKPAARGISALP